MLETVDRCCASVEDLEKLQKLSLQLQTVRLVTLFSNNIGSSQVERCNAIAQTHLSPKGVVGVSRWSHSLFGKHRSGRWKQHSRELCSLNLQVPLNCV